MINSNYYIWLQSALGTGATVEHIFSVFNSAEEIYRAGDKGRKLSGVFKPAQLEKMRNTDIDTTYSVLELCAKNGIDVITPDNSIYPKNLLHIRNYPLVLYAEGDLSCLGCCVPISIVGTRKAEPQSSAAVGELSKQLAKLGFVVVSGGALGIDSAAHTGALLAGGKTVAVLGCGIGYRYLMENEPLRRVIASKGALISEYPPFSQPFRGTFPMRNRIISGISEGVIVAQAGLKSGSLLTAKHAYSQNRDVFALDIGDIGTSNYGVKELLEDGAKPVSKPWDIVEEYLYKYPDRIIIDESVDMMKNISGCECISADKDAYTELEKLESILKKRTTESKPTESKPTKKEISDSMSEDSKAVYGLFSEQPMSVNELIQMADMPTGRLLGALTELEIFGYINMLPNAKYILNSGN